MGSLVASPAAVFLLGLSQQHATGALSVAGRTLFVRSGRCVEVTPTETDEPIVDFLRRSGQIDHNSLLAAQSEADEHGKVRDPASTNDLIERAGGLSKLSREARVSLRRALFLDRLVRALREMGERSLAALDPSGTTPRVPPDARGYDLLPMVLDALARVATTDDAGVVGAAPQARLQWLLGPFVAQARTWAGLQNVTGEPTVATVLKTAPAAAPKIAAIVRAGIARLQEPAEASERESGRTGTLPPPAPRLNMAPRAISSLPPEPSTRPPRGRLEPGRAGAAAEPIDPERPPPLPPVDPGLADPLRELELEIERLERDGAPGRDRAQRWIQLADLWERRLFSVAEATRALREAAAADPRAPQLLERTARSCVALGEHELALAYADAAAQVADDPVGRRQALSLAAQIALRGGKPDNGLERLKALCSEPPGRGRDSEASEASHERLYLLLEPTDPVAAASVAARHAAHCPDARRAALFYRLALAHRTEAPLLSENHAQVLRRTQRPGAAIATLGWAANEQSDPVQAARLLKGAAVVAAEANRTEAGLSLLNRAYDLQPEDPELQDRLAGILNRTGQDEALSVLRLDLVHHPGPVTSSTRLEQAAIAAEELTGEGEFARLLRRSLEDPGEVDFHKLANSLNRRANETHDPQEQAILYRRLAGLRHAAGDLRGTASAALRCLALAPQDTLAIARLLRAAGRLQSSTPLLEALRYATRTATDEQARGALLTRTAWHLRRSGRTLEALDQAEAALVCDPDNGEAAYLLAACIEALPEARRRTVLATCLAALPDDVVLLRAHARALVREHLSASRPDMEATRKHLDAWRRLLPRDPEPHHLLLQLASREEDARSIRMAAEGALDNLLRPERVQDVRAAANRLAELGELAPATRLLLRVGRTTVTRDPAVADQALEYARLTADNELVTRSLEWRANLLEGDSHARALSAIATHHQREGDALSELRARIRQLLAAGPGSDAARRLLHLLVGFSDLPRLLALLTLDLQMAPSAEARNTLRAQMAQAALALSSDGAECDRQLDAWVAADPTDRGALRALLAFVLGMHGDDHHAGVAMGLSVAARAPESAGARLRLWLAQTAELRYSDPDLALAICARGAPDHPLCGELLLMVERLTMERGDMHTAMGVYDAMVERAAGNHGRRALLYRAGRWLEQAGHTTEALARFAAALALSPSPGVVLNAMARAAIASDDVGPVVDAYLQVAKDSTQPDAKRHWWKEALELCQAHELGARREFVALHGLSQLEPSSELDRSMCDCLPRLFTEDEEIGRQAVSGLEQAWNQRLAGSPDPETQVQLLLCLSELPRACGGDEQPALAHLDRALAIVDKAGLTDDLHADVLCARAVVLRSLKRPQEALAAVRSAQTIAPAHRYARELLEELSSYSQAGAGPAKTPDPTPATPPPSTPGLASDQPDTLDIPQAVAGSRRTASFARPDEALLARASLSPRPPINEAQTTTGRTTPGVQAPDDAKQEGDLRAAAERGDSEALTGLARFLETKPDALPEAHHCYARLVRNEPFRTDALRGLHRTALGLDAGAIAQVTAQLLAAFDADLDPPSVHPIDPSQWNQGELRTLLEGPIDGDLWHLLAMTFDATRSLSGLHKELASYGIAERDAVTELDDGPLAQALACAKRVLGFANTAMYVRQSDEPGLSVAARTPPTIIATTALATAPGLQAHIAKALVAAQPEHVLLNGLAPDEAATLLEGLKAAFGPAEQFAGRSRGAKLAASVLWDGIPKRSHAWAQATVADNLGVLNYDHLHAASGVAQMLAALFATASPTEALATVVDPAQLSDEMRFQQVCKEHPVACEVIRLVLSDEYLSALTQSL